MSDITNLDQLSVALPLHWDNTNSRLGIGTELPQVPLHVVGDARFDSTVTIFNLGTGNLRVDNGVINIDTTPAPSATIKGSCGVGYLPKMTPDTTTIAQSILYNTGNSVGINTSDPQTTLQVAGGLIVDSSSTLTGPVDISASLHVTGGLNVDNSSTLTGQVVLQNLGAGTGIVQSTDGTLSLGALPTVSGVQGSGLVNRVPHWIDSTTLANSVMSITDTTAYIPGQLNVDGTGTIGSVRIAMSTNPSYGNVLAVGGGSYFNNLSIGTAVHDQPLSVNGNSYFNGRVGIDTTSPVTTLDVNGDIVASGKIVAGYESTGGYASDKLHVVGNARFNETVRFQRYFHWYGNELVTNMGRATDTTGTSRCGGVTHTSEEQLLINSGSEIALFGPVSWPYNVSIFCRGFIWGSSQSTDFIVSNNSLSLINSSSSLISTTTATGIKVYMAGVDDLRIQNNTAGTTSIGYTFKWWYNSNVEYSGESPI